MQNIYSNLERRVMNIHLGIDIQDLKNFQMIYSQVKDSFMNLFILVVVGI